MTKREARKAARAAKPAPTEGQHMMALMDGFFGGLVIFAVFAVVLISNAPA